MLRLSHAAFKYPFLFFLALFFFAGRPVEFGQEKTFFHGYVIERPIIRVAIGRNLKEIKIQASSGMKIYEVNHRYRLLKAEANELLVRGKKIPLTEKFLVQVAQSESRREAEKLAAALEQKVPGRLRIVEEVDRLRGRRLYCLRYGDFLTRGEALSFLSTMNQAGWGEAWILREEVVRAEKNSFWALVDDEIVSFPERTTLYVVPANGWSILSFNGNRYRGMFILRGLNEGLQAVNVLNLEDYLKGVVPAELSPGSFGELEALKAQAVAARSYAWRNLGLNADQDFDLTSTPDDQAYGGLDAEHPLSNQAVEATGGQVLLYRGKPANALYTSTCGGMTEGGKAVFGGSDLAYLKAVECVEEKLTPHELSSSRPARRFSSGTKDLTFDLALLTSLSIIDHSYSQNWLEEPLGRAEVKNWVEKTATYLGLSGQPWPVSLPLPEEPLTISGFSHYLIEAFGWRERVQNLLLASEVAWLLRDFPKVAERDRRSVAYLLNQGYLPASAEIVNGLEPISRAKAIVVLSRIIQKEKPPLRSAIFRGQKESEVIVEVEGKTVPLLLASSAWLFRSLSDEVSPASRLTLLGGERLLYLEKEGQVVFLEAIYPAATSVLDRSSVYSGWQVRYSREDLSRRVNEYFPLGLVKDLRILRRGQSRRVLELEIEGEKGHAVVRGLRVRWVLGLRDTLFTVDREWQPDGQIGYFIFTGRGWGHGVGMCQVGAYGMAQRGATYREILNKYYSGTKITKLY